MLVTRHREDRPDIDRFPVPVGPVSPADVLKARRQNADDPEGTAGEADASSDHRRVAIEAPHPQAVAEDHHLVPALQLVVRFELAAEDRLAAEQLEESGGDLHAAELFGPGGIPELEIAAKVCGQALEGLQLRAIVTKIRRRHREVRRVRRLLEQPEEAVGLRIRERSNQHALHGAENRGVGANRQRQGEDRRRGKAGRSAKQPDGVAQVVAERLEDRGHGAWTGRTRPAFTRLRASRYGAAGWDARSGSGASRTCRDDRICGEMTCLS
jgi:hypothetical protein